MDKKKKNKACCQSWLIVSYHESGKLNLRNLERLSRVLSDIMNSGVEVILVSSGAQAARLWETGVA